MEMSTAGCSMLVGTMPRAEADGTGKGLAMASTMAMAALDVADGSRGLGLLLQEDDK